MPHVVEAYPNQQVNNAGEHVRAHKQADDYTNRNNLDHCIGRLVFN